MQKKYAFVVSAVIMLAALLVLLHTSLWFLWHLLPPGTMQLAVNSQRHEVVQRQVVPFLVPEITPHLPAVRRFAVSRVGDSTTLIAVPQLRTQRSLVSQLTAAGWRVRRLGAVIISQRGEARRRASVPEAFFQTLKAVFRPSVPSRPLILTALGSNTLPGISQPLVALGTAKEGVIQVIIAQTLDKTLAQPDQADAVVSPVTGLSVALPGHIISSIPEEIWASWNDAVLNRFNFTHTHPNLLASLNQHSFVRLSIDTSEATLAVAGNPAEFLSVIRQAVRAEEAYARPTRQAFRLPDGTIGFEQVPGSPRPVFEETAAARCRPGLNLWLCETDSRAALGTNQPATQAALANLEGEWSLEASSEYLANTPLQFLAAITASGKGNYMVISAQLQ